MKFTIETTLGSLGLEPPVREYRFAKPRRWRFDFAWVDRKLAFEVEGAVWTGGRHTRGAGYSKDCEKYSTAAALGWRVIRATTQQVESGEALRLLRMAVELN